jgi:hypothetical protein
MPQGHPHMTARHQARFLAALEALEHLCRDTLSDEQRESYWQAVSVQISLQEWEAATQEAMRQVTDYRMPLPAHLVAIVQDQRRQQRTEALLALMPRRSRHSLLSHLETLRQTRSAAPLWAFLWPEEARQRHSVIAPLDALPANDRPSPHQQQLEAWLEEDA